MEVLQSVCPYDCPDTCGLLVHIEDGKVVKVQGDPDNPFTRGTLCPKMAHYEKTVHSPRRILTPLKRTAPKGSGSFEAISWEEAIKHIKTKWNEIIDKYGAEAILPYSYAGTMGLVQRNAGYPFFYSLGASRLERTICSPVVVGAWSKPGGGLLTGTSTSSAFDISLVTREDFQESTTRLINMNKLGDALNEVNDPPIMSLYVYHSNPAVITPDQNKVLQGLSREDLFTVVHERFMTDTAKYADIVLPATTSLEHSDIYRAYGHYNIQRAYGVIPPVGEAKSNWEVFCLLAEAMGINKPFFNQSADNLIDSILEQPSSWLKSTRLETLIEGKPLELPLTEGYKTQFRTPSGKIEILNTMEDESLPKYSKPHGDNADFWLVNSPDARLLNSSFNERDDLTRTNKMLLQMNPDDAVKIGLKDEQLVVAYNERGEVTYKLKITSKVPKGIVVTEGAWWLENTVGNRSTNTLTSQRLTDNGRGSTFYDVKVNVRAAVSEYKQ